MEKDLAVVYVPKTSCFIVLFFIKMNNIIYSYLYKTRKPKNSYTQIMVVIEKKSNPLLPWVFHYKKAKI